MMDRDAAANTRGCAGVAARHGRRNLLAGAKIFGATQRVAIA